MTQNDATQKITKEYQVIKAHGTEIWETTVEVCTESRIIFTLNGGIIGDLSITPLDLEAFAIGYLICEGYICSSEEIQEITISLPNISVRTGTGSVPSGKFSKNSSGGSCVICSQEACKTHFLTVLVCSVKGSVTVPGKRSCIVI